MGTHPPTHDASRRNLRTESPVTNPEASLQPGKGWNLGKEIAPRRYGDNARTAAETLEAVRKQGWEIVILDVSMPDKSGLDILKDLKRLRPKLPVLLLGTQPEEQFARRALKIGAAGYLTKEGVSEELTQGLRKVLDGGRYVSATLAESLAQDLRGEREAPLHERLSNREFQVLRMIASGQRVKKIAHTLSLSVKTVSTYRTRILRKTGMKSNAELIRYAIQNQLVD